MNQYYCKISKFADVGVRAALRARIDNDLRVRPAMLINSDSQSDVVKSYRDCWELIIDRREHEFESLFAALDEAILNITKQHFQIECSPKLLSFALLKYQAGGFYHWHSDVGPGIAAKRMLSLICQLTSSCEFAGGEFEFSFGSPEIVPLNEGDLLAFPSVIPHRVRMITAGTRYALVAWALES